MGRRKMRSISILSVLTCVISCFTLFSLIVSLYHVNSSSLSSSLMVVSPLQSPLQSHSSSSSIVVSSSSLTTTSLPGTTLISDQQNGPSRSDFQRSSSSGSSRRAPSSVTKSASSTLETPDHDDNDSTSDSIGTGIGIGKTHDASPGETTSSSSSVFVPGFDDSKLPEGRERSHSIAAAAAAAAAVPTTRSIAIAIAGEESSSASKSKFQTKTETKTKTETDVLCSSCRYSPIGPKSNIPCIQRMQLKIKMAYSGGSINSNNSSNNSNNNSSNNNSSNNNNNNNNNRTMTLVEAGRNIAIRRPDYCGRCDPEQCSTTDKHYWRFDAAGPAEQVPSSSSAAAATSSSAAAAAAASSASRTHYLQSIGPEARLPVSARQNLTAYFADPAHNYPVRDYLFEFNPSLVQLPVGQIPVNHHHRDRGGDGAVYLASFRVSNMHNCVTDPDNILHMMGGGDDGDEKGKGKRFGKKTRHQVKDYLGLALLRADLTIVADTVVDAKNIVHKMQDPRLFVLRDQIYLGSYHRMTPLWLVPPAPAAPASSMVVSASDSDTNSSNAVDGAVPASNRAAAAPILQVPNMWESNMTVWLRTFGSCTKDREIQRKGKNLNYFVDADNRTVMEMFPGGPKEEIELDARCTKSAEEDPPGTFVFPNMLSAVPLPSFGTVEELDLARERMFEPVITGARGSYCCVPIAVKGQRLLLGIAHSKTKYNHKQGTDAYSEEGQIQANHFFSSFYAIRDRAPYNVVARSGKFCLGFARDEDESDNPYTMMNMVPLQLMGRTFDCPRIHFVTGMVEKADDPSKVIISYGINDCVPRMVVVDKAEITQMLFDVQARLPPSEFATTSSDG